MPRNASGESVSTPAMGESAKADSPAKKHNIADMPNVIAVRMDPRIKCVVAGLSQWTPFAPGLEAAQTNYQAWGWKAPRRLVVVREELRERREARGRILIEVPGYTFDVLVTSLEHDPVTTWRFYNSRADSENRLKELKEDFGADGFCLPPSTALKPPSA